jgi:hypothetical protein
VLLALTDVVCMPENSVDNVITAEELLDDADSIDMNEELRLVAELVGVTELSKSDPSEDFVTSGMSGISGAVKVLIMRKVLG